MAEDRKPPGLPEPPKRKLSRLSIGFGVFTLVMIVVGVMTFFAPHPAERPEGLWMPGFDLQGHRGARGLYPENTLEGFERTLALGIDVLEMDVVLTADGTLVVHHDLRLDAERTRDAAGAWIEAPGPAIKSLTDEDLKAYDVGRWHEESEGARRFSGQLALDGVAIPALADVLRRVETLSGGRMRYNIELKTNPLRAELSPDPVAAAQGLVALLDSLDLGERVVVQSFDWRALVEVERLRPEIMTGFTTVEREGFDTLRRGEPGPSPWLAGLDLDDGPTTPPVAVKHLGGSVWQPFYQDLQPADLEEAHRLGLRVVVWTVNDPGVMVRLIEAGVDGIITDYPDRLRRVMTEAGLDLPPSYP